MTSVDLVGHSRIDFDFGREDETLEDYRERLLNYILNELKLPHRPLTGYIKVAQLNTKGVFKMAGYNQQKK